MPRKPTTGLRTIHCDLGCGAGFTYSSNSKDENSRENVAERNHFYRVVGGGRWRCHTCANPALRIQPPPIDKKVEREYQRRLQLREQAKAELMAELAAQHERTMPGHVADTDRPYNPALRRQGLAYRGFGGEKIT